MTKTLVLIIIIIFLCAGFILYIQGYFHPLKDTTVSSIPQISFQIPLSPTREIIPVSPTPGITQEVSLSSKDAEKAVYNYYVWYTNCLKNHFAAISPAPSRSPQEDCPYNTGGIISDNLLPVLQKAVGLDPILCSQNIPQSVSFDPAVVTEGGIVTVRVHSQYASSGDNPIDVQMQPINNQWKMTNISCLKH